MLKKSIEEKTNVLKNIENSLNHFIDEYEREYFEELKKITKKKRQQLIKKYRDRILENILK